MNILITGSNGFIGKNLKNFIQDNYGYQILEFNKGDTLQELDYKIKNSNFINRTSSSCGRGIIF